MIAAAILIVHFAACVYAFFTSKKEGIGEGILAAAFVVIIFSVGWTMTTMLAKLVYPYRLVERWVGSLQGTSLSRLFSKELTIDTFALVLLTIGESVFYYYYLRSEKNPGTTKTGN